MNILSSIVPGIRELRTPLTVGLLWLSVIIVLGVTHNVTLFPHTHVEAALHHISSTFAAFLATSAIVFGAFLLGNVMIGITNPFAYLAGRHLRTLIIRAFTFVLRSGRLPVHSYIDRQRYRFSSRTRTVSTSARGLVMEANSRALAQAGVPGSATLMFPLDEVIKSLPFTAPQLSQTAPTQYQEYDRARSEVDFRVGVVPPIVVLAAVLPIEVKPWILIGVAFAGLILLLQAVGQARHSMDILANAAYLGYVTVPMIKSVTEYLSGLTETPEQDGQWMGAIVYGLWRGGYYEESDAMMHELAELNEHDRHVLREYLGDHEPELAEQLDRLIDQARTINARPKVADLSDQASPSDQ